MNTVITHAPEARLRHIGPSVRFTLLVVLVAAIFFGLSHSIRAPRFVERVTVRNPTDQLVEVSVTNGDGDDDLTIATVEPGRSRSVESVVDQGATWLFRYQAPGSGVNEVRMSHAQLERTNWQVVVPNTPNNG